MGGKEDGGETARGFGGFRSYGDGGEGECLTNE